MNKRKINLHPQSLKPIEYQAVMEFLTLITSQVNQQLKSVYLFGSKARGDDTPDSDIDVLVVVDRNNWQLKKKIRYLAADMELKYDVDLSTRVWSMAEMEQMKTMNLTIYRNIKRDGIMLFDNYSSLNADL